MNESNKKIILTAGGTGGHLYGALSLTEELKSKWRKAVNPESN